MEGNEKSLSKEARGGSKVRSALQRQVVVAVGEMVGTCQLSRFGGWLRLFQCVCIMNLRFTDLGLQNVSFICFYIFIFLT